MFSTEGVKTIYDVHRAGVKSGVTMTVGFKGNSSMDEIRWLSPDVVWDLPENFQTRF